MDPNDFAVEILVEVLASLVYPLTLTTIFLRGSSLEIYFYSPPPPLIFPLNYSSLNVIFIIKSGCCDENSAFESRKA